MNYIIEFEDQAINDIEHIGDYIEQNLHAPQAARNLYNGNALCNYTSNHAWGIDYRLN